MTVILGIDPGTGTTGYGGIEVSDEQRNMEILGCGTVSTPTDMPFQNRLKAIHDSIQTLVDKFSPSVVAVEELYFSKNVKTAIDVGHARGAIMVSLAEIEVTVEEYNPLTIKKTLTGNGNADKKAVQKMVKQELELTETPSPNDAADALAIAICHNLQSRFESKIDQS
ncbi:MAG: crossover junction endodeoxyribonuclease RuvC [bacterium]